MGVFLVFNRHADGVGFALFDFVGIAKHFGK